jgi:putative glutamine amidotransferase
LSQDAHPAPLIAIPLHANWSEVKANPELQSIQMINSAYLQALSEAGASPVLLPLGTAVPASLDWADGLLLPGGIDIDPHRYGADPHPTSEYDPEQDELDFQLLAMAVRLQLPILGICRGLQVLNVGLGGTLVQDLPSQRPSEIGHPRQGERNFLSHRIQVTSGTRLQAILGGDDFSVNSMHHQGIDELAPPLRASARSTDGLVEGVETSGAGWAVGVQFHPEELVGEHDFARGLFRAFVEECSGARRSARRSLVEAESKP